MTVEQPPDRAGGNRQIVLLLNQIVLLLKMRHDLGQRDVRCLVDQCQDPTGMGLQPMRASVTAARLWLDAARAPSLLQPLDRCGRGYAEARRSGAA